MITVVGMFKSLGAVAKKTPKGLEFFEYQLEPFGGEGAIKATTFNKKHRFTKGTVLFISGDLQMKAWSKGDKTSTFYNVSVKTMEDINASAGRSLSEEGKNNKEEEKTEVIPF